MAVHEFSTVCSLISGGVVFVDPLSSNLHTEGNFQTGFLDVLVSRYSVVQCTPPQSGLAGRYRPDVNPGVHFENIDRQTHGATFVPVWPDWLEFDGLYFQTAPS